MTIPPLSSIEEYVVDGRLTLTGQRLLKAIIDEVETESAKMTAIAAVTSPSGGATIDAEARTAIDAIIAAAT